MLSEGGRIQTGPGIVSSKHNTSLVSDKLVDNVIFRDLVGGKVTGDVNERRQTAGGEALEPLHSGGGRIGHELVDLAMGDPGGGVGAAQLVQDGQLVEAVAGLRQVHVVHAEVVPQGVHHQDHGLAEYLGWLVTVLPNALGSI